MEAYFVDWFSVIVRWLHLITGIAWIGASLHFAWLDNSLEEPDEDQKAQGIKGDLWAIHGGGIYNFNKYALAPPTWPSVLHWSKWEAYTTWITGTLLMVAVYYLQAQSYLVGSDKWIVDPNVAIAASVGYLLSGMLVYEALVRSPLRHQAMLFAGLLAVFIALQCWLATKLFSDRAAFLHVGALMGTIMAGNVFLGIIPAQKKFVAAVQAGQDPDPAPAAFAKQRSMHNNYFTLPVLFCMISNHYPFLYGHSYNWVILIAIMAITAYARHFFNQRNRGIVDYSILVKAFVAFILLSGALGIERYEQQRTSVAMDVADGAAFALIDAHCAVCHSQTPTQPGFVVPPAGILMDDRDVILQSADQMLTAVQTNYMPLGNLTGMTDDERAELVSWLQKKTNL
ncbi:MAG: hypothetical protein HOF19_15680 [Gammaproteobacteria bacterium]|nr:hypothetical protein [Gammaproteobacteria bacterium]MBT6572148.1 hypothetical protein [Gammaproteobacteria bacterium]